MSAARTPAVEAVESHVRAFFEGHCVKAVEADPGPEAGPAGLRVLVVGPGPRGDGWAYVTAGCSAATASQAGNGVGLEFVMTAHVRDRRFVDVVAAIARYHRAGHRLGPEHSLPIGEPWVPGSACDHVLISLPYLHGPGLEHCPVPGGHARILWALPVTAAEIGFRRRFGHDALERRFDEAAIVPTDPFRASVV
ncbi:suppressor of fused domain protein [Kitasatospora sp. NPDC002551]|uniref:suppressor of fused domain protein n=1 Tax=unclassified Kitasatospora TaxID=2633591 RepID=UPI0033301B65